MNRTERRALTNSKGGLDARVERIDRAERNLQKRIDGFDQLVNDTAKNFASATIQKEFMPLTVAILIDQFAFDPEQVMKYTALVDEGIDKRLAVIHGGEWAKNEHVQNTVNTPNAAVSEE